MARPRVDEAEIVRMHECGLSVSQIAIRVGCCTRTVQRVRHEHGLSAPVAANAFVRVAQERLDSAAALFADGASRAEVTKTIGLHQRTIEKYFPGTAWSMSDAGRWARTVYEFDRAIEKIALPTQKGKK